MIQELTSITGCTGKLAILIYCLYLYVQKPVYFEVSVSKKIHQSLDHVIGKGGRVTLLHLLLSVRVIVLETNFSLNPGLSNLANISVLPFYAFHKMKQK